MKYQSNYLLLLLTAFITSGIQKDAYASVTTSFQEHDITRKVKILAIKNPDRRPLQSFLYGLEAAEKFQSFAPKADVGFQLLPQQNVRVNIQGLNLRLVSSDAEAVIPMEEDGFFRLDKNMSKGQQEDIEVIVSTKSGTTRFQSAVRSPNLLVNEKRLGDLRLQCEMDWAMNKRDLTFLMKVSLSMGASVCQSKKVAIAFAEPRRFTSVSLEEGERKIFVYKGKAVNRYVPPIYDQSWGNDAKLTFEYETEIAE
ncbi:hypothetical protein [Undibacterium fentianense]|uniref:Uncharacterized protein n=1 Tax=Undibacterium fentianense TaxID=2828728 RepID=A0A941ID87_9BURK|nr:hypothetical protein [Undibacterium fentianense]MBR7799698.1 hypothetical protein [Undibacterium fentianense]